MINKKLIHLTLITLILSSFVTTVYGITNGKPDGEYHPYVCMVLVDSNGDDNPDFYETGILLSPTVVLTTAHILDGDNQESIYSAIVHIGEQVVPEVSKYYTASSWIKHPDYNPPSDGNGKDRLVPRNLGMITLREASKRES